MPCCVVIFMLIGQWFRFVRAVKRLLGREGTDEGDNNDPFRVVPQAPPLAPVAYGQAGTLAR